MWSICPENKLESYFQRYPHLEKMKDAIILHQTYGRVFFPRYFYWNFPGPELILHHDPTFNPQKLDWLEFTSDPNKQLRSDQPRLVAPFISRIDNNHLGGVLKARPGAGKTVMGIYIACATKSKTLIIIDNNNLVEQWVNTIINFTNCTEDNIGVIQGDKLELDKAFTIAMVQTFMRRSSGELLSEYYAKLKDAGYNLVWYDECHKTSSGQKYALSSLLINTPNSNGLSATPFHEGVHRILMENTVGPVISDSKNYDIKPEINIVKYVSGISDNEWVYKNGRRVSYLTYVRMAGDFMRQRARYNSIIIESRRYLEIVRMINEAELENGERIINIVFTKPQVKEIVSELKIHGINAIPFYSEQKKLDKETTKSMVATYSYAGTGFDYKELSVCVIATPLSGRKSLIQVIGRVLRSCEGKTKAKAYIMIDMDFGNMFSKDIDTICNKLKDEFNCNIKILDVY